MSSRASLITILLASAGSCSDAFAPPSITFSKRTYSATNNLLLLEKENGLTQQKNQRNTTTHLFMSSSDSATSTIPTDLLPKVREGVEEAGGLEAWDACLEILGSRVPSLDRDEAEFLLARAHQWRSWASARSDLARKFIQTSLPTVDQLEAALTWLTTSTGTLELSQEQLVNSIREFPHVYLTNPEETYHKALKAAPSEFKDPNAFKDLILERPEALQFTFNCKDDGCQSECGSCWVTNDNR